MAEPETISLWPGEPPNETREFQEEVDTTKPDSNLVGGERLIRLTNVFHPTLEVYRPSEETDTGASVVICPGGGHSVLAWDLEGTEVAEWLNTIGVTGIVLKYRVPTRDKDGDRDHRWGQAVEDGQRAVSFVRANAEEWGLDPARIGICGFSAGGQTAVMTALFQDERTYDAIDEVDSVSCRPDFAMLIYTAYMVDKETGELYENVANLVAEDTPPMFFVHAWDDRVTPLSSIKLAEALKHNNVDVGLHIYPQGGHGYGLRRTEMPITSWPDRAEDWLRSSGILNADAE